MEEMSAIAALRNVQVEFGKNRERSLILNNVTLTVPEKSIIGLIGPSGCGKTTLLRTLIGLVPVKSGQISVGGYQNGDVCSKLSPSFLGYMPQDSGLHDLWKAIDMFRFAGRVLNIKQNEIDRRIKLLQEKIDLPSNLEYISSMSGGEKRRMSLALALIHQPKLLILDEPTVGSDPLSRIKIWKYLEECRDRFGMTIIITTHYIEEVNEANSIAFMYQGQVMCHEEPKIMLRIHGAANLEAATYTICRNYIENQNRERCETIKGSEEFWRADKFQKLPPIEPSRGSLSISQTRIFWASFVRIAAEWRFNLLSAFFFSFWFTFLIFVLANYLWRAPKEMPLCLLSNENGANEFSSITQRFINEVNSSTLLNLKFCAPSFEDTSRGKMNSFISIGSGFERDLYLRAFHLDYDENISPLLYYHGQTLNPIESQLIERFFHYFLIDKIIKLRHSTNVTRSRHLFEILKVEPIDGKAVEDNDRRVYSYVSPLFFIFFIYMYGQAYGCSSLALDRMGGFYDRQKSMGIKPGPLMLAHIIRANLQHIPIFNIAGLILCLASGYQLNTSVWKFLGTSHFIAVSGYCFGCYLGTQTSSFFALISILFLYNLSQLWFNHLLWPTAALPYFMRPLLLVYPYGASVESTQRVLMGFEGEGIRQFLVPSIWIILFTTLALRSLR